MTDKETLLFQNHVSLTDTYQGLDSSHSQEIHKADLSRIHHESPSSLSSQISQIGKSNQVQISPKGKTLWHRTGFTNKNLWDWMQLPVTPIAITAGTLWFTAQQNHARTQMTQDQQQETVLQTYLDQMSDLLLNNNLRESRPGDAVRNVARSQTLSILSQLNGIWKGELVQFLREFGLIRPQNKIIGLEEANLSSIDLSNIYLTNVKLSSNNLISANLNKFNVTEFPDE